MALLASWGRCGMYVMLVFKGLCCCQRMGSGFVFPLDRSLLLVLFFSFGKFDFWFLFFFSQQIIIFNSMTTHSIEYLNASELP